MKSYSFAWLDWLWGPALGGAVISWLFVGVNGPGFAILFFLVGICFIILVPLIQFFLLRTRLFRGKVAAAAISSIFIMFFVIIFSIIIFAMAGGAFSYW
jgi:phosphoglycerol transferase MdoB-like AlkP superfamily enzyme